MKFWYLLHVLKIIFFILVLRLSSGAGCLFFVLPESLNSLYICVKEQDRSWREYMTAQTCLSLRYMHIIGDWYQNS